MDPREAWYKIQRSNSPPLTSAKEMIPTPRGLSLPVARGSVQL